MEAKLGIGGVFHFKAVAHYHDDGSKCLLHGKCGQAHVEKILWEADAKNAVTTEGLNHVLNTEFHGDAAVGTWYIGLIKTAYAHDAADTLASHAGWTEAVLTTDYTGNRPAWTEGAAAAGVMTNAATVDFAMLTSITVKGALLCGAATGTSAALFCSAAFTGGDQAVNNGDTLKVTYTVTATAV